MLIRFTVGPPFFFPYPMSSLGDAIIGQHRIRFAPGNADAGRVAMAAGILSKGIVDRFGCRGRVGRWMAAAGDGAPSMFGREEKQRPAAMRRWEVHR